MKMKSKSHNLKIILFSITFFAILLPAFCEKEIKLFVLINTSSSLKVTSSDAELIGTELGKLIGSALSPNSYNPNANKVYRRDEGHSKKFQKLITDYNRYDVFVKMLKSVFKENGNYFDLDFQEDTKKTKDYFVQTVLKNETVTKKDHKYALVINDVNSGYKTPSEENFMIKSGYSEVDLYLFDLKNKKKMYKGTFARILNKQRKLDDIFADKNLFFSDYPIVVKALCETIYGNLNREELIHKMAATYGLQKKFPQVKAILADYRKKFDCKFKLPSGWQKYKTLSDYQFVLAPRKDKEIFAISCEVDLLIEVFGQDVSFLDEYVKILFKRLGRSGWDIAPLKKYSSDLNLDLEWDSYIIEATNKGTNIFLFRKESDDFIRLFIITFLLGEIEGIYEDMYEEYKKDIEYVINNSKFELK